MLTRPAPAVLDDVRERLLDDPVERRLDLARAAARRRAASRGRRARPLCSRNVARSRSMAGTRPKSSSADGRSSTASRRTSCSVETTSSRSDATASRASSVSAACSSGFRPSRIDVSAWPVSSCSSRASRARSSSWASTTRRTASRLTRWREVDGDRGAGGERLGEPQVVVREARASDRACRARPRRRSPGRARSAARTSAECTPSRRAACWSISGSSSTESTRSLRPRSSTRPAFEPLSSSSHPDDAVARSRPRLPRRAASSPSGSAISTSRASTSSRSRRATRASSGSSSSSDGERVADLVQRLELAQPARRALVQPRVLDRDRRLRREQLRQLLVLVREVLPALLLGQVEVPVGDAAQHDRHAEEASSSAGGCGGKPTERGSSARSCSRSGFASRISTPRIPRPRGRSPIAACVSASMPVVRKRSSAWPGLVDHAERRVARAGQLGRRLDDPLQQRVERELRAERDPRVRRGRGGDRAGASPRSPLGFSSMPSARGAQQPSRLGARPVRGAPRVAGRQSVTRRLRRPRTHPARQLDEGRHRIRAEAADVLDVELAGLLPPRDVPFGDAEVRVRRARTRAARPPSRARRSSRSAVARRWRRRPPRAARRARRSRSPRAVARA